MKERDEELVLFLEMRRREMEKNDQFLLFDSSDELLDASLGSYGGDAVVPEVVQSMPVHKTAAENFLDAENEKSDYDWLITPPGTPLFPSLEKETQRKTLMSQNGISNTRATVLKSRLENLPEEPAPRKTLSPRQGTLPTPQNSSSTSIRSSSNKRPSSSGVPKSASRPSTPTSRPTLPTTTKPSRSSTPTSRATLPSTKPAAASSRSSTPTSRATLPSTKTVASSARSSTPTSRATLPATKPAASSARSSTPTSRAILPSTKPAPSSARSSTPTRSTARSSTPTARPSITTTKSASRSATPTYRPVTPSSAPNTAKPSAQSSTLTKSAPAPSKNPVPSRGTSPTVRSRPFKPSDMPGLSNDAPPNLKTSLPQRPLSASRGRPGASSIKPSVDANSNGRPRRQSCSPSKSRTSTGSAHGSVNSIRPGDRVEYNSSDNDSPVVMGNKMVERVVNMRKLAPPKHDYELPNHKNPSGKLSTSMDSTGFGRTLSKKSLDMAIRHMDIRRTISGNQRSHVTNVPASSIYSVRSTSSKSKSVSITDSPHATSSNSSEPSVNNHPISLDAYEIDRYNDLANERGNASPISHHAI